MSEKVSKRHSEKAAAQAGLGARSGITRKDFLPVSKADMEERGIGQLDFVYVIGDAYVDHPSFGFAIISRVLEAHGYQVGIISQPDWKDPESIAALGEPRLAFLVSAGNMDSCVNHYSVSKRRRKTDAYTPGGVMGKRPDRAAMVYCNLIRSRFKDIPIIAGGIEASLRRMAHYDYWDDALRRSYLMDSGVDLISYGMGERSIVEIADALASGLRAEDLTFIPGTCFRTKDLGRAGINVTEERLAAAQEEIRNKAADDSDGGAALDDDTILLPSYDMMLADRRQYARSFYTQNCNTDPFVGKRLVEPYGSVYVVQNRPAKPLTVMEMDDVYDLPYARAAHPDALKIGPVPATEEISYSLISNRGCFGGCSFCALTFHQGRIVQTRSPESILKEARLLTQEPGFKGYIHDVGGPTANFYHPSCEKQLTKGVCKHRQCLTPEPCPNLNPSHTAYVNLLKQLRELPGVKKVFVRSGVRFDYCLEDKSGEFLRELVQYHISGQLKVAPEHVAPAVLEAMGKPGHEVFMRFTKEYERVNRELHMQQFLVPYLMSSHPGCRMEDAVRLAEYLRDIHHQPEQVQDFYPTPSTLSTCMYYTGLDPRTMKEIYVPKNPHEKAMQRALMQFRDPKNYELVKEALTIAHREDLIGFGPECLIRPRKGSSQQPHSHQDRKDGKKRGKR